MPSVVFIGGPLDGELREVQPGCAEYEIDRDDIQRHPEYSGYWLANGIARHESVSEEEVGRMFKALMLTVGVSTWDMTKGAE